MRRDAKCENCKLSTTRLTEVLRLSMTFGACLYRGELSLAGGLPSIPSRVLQSVYMGKIVPADRDMVDLAFRLDFRRSLGSGLRSSPKRDGWTGEQPTVSVT